MDIGSIFLVLALLILVSLYISRPLMERKKKRNVNIQPEEIQRSSLMAERDRVIATLQEMDFDHLMGKIRDEDYQAQRVVFIQRGADILRQLDTLENVAQAQAVSAEDRLEAAIASRRIARQPAYASPTGELTLEADPAKENLDDELEVQIASRRRARRDKTGGFCPHCGGPVQKHDRFCPRCGTTLK